MATIVTRAGKGTTLSWAEMDANFNNLNTKVSEIISVKDFGAVGDGVIDDTAAVQLALDSGAKVVTFPAGSYKWSGNGPIIRSNTRVVGDQALIIQPNADTGATISTGAEYAGFRIDCGSSNIIIEGLDIRGPYYGLTPQGAYRSIGINISGRYDQYFYNNSNYPSNPIIPVSGTSQNITIKSNKISGFGQSCVVADQIDNFYCYGNNLSNTTRDGVRMYGVKYFNVSDNYIQNMAPGFTTEGSIPNFNVYGITATRIYHSTAGDGSLTDYRSPSFGIISRNTIRDCPTWKALDTHGGTDISFINNHVHNAHIGIGLDKGGYDTADGYAPPRRINVSGNHIVADSSNTAGNRCGIFCVAHDATADNIGENLTISNNYVEGFGEDTRDGNIVVSNFRLGMISDNQIVGGLRSGINFQETIEEFSVQGGTISNVAMTTGLFLAGVAMQAASQRIVVDGVVFKKTDTADVMNAISTVSPTAGYGIKLGDGNSYVGNVTIAPFQAHLMVDSPFITRCIAYGNINNNGTTASISAGKGITSVTRTGTGAVDVVLDESLSTNNTIIPIAMGKSSNVLCYATVPDTSTISVATRTATTAASVDTGFYLQVQGY